MRPGAVTDGLGEVSRTRSPVCEMNTHHRSRTTAAGRVDGAVKPAPQALQEAIPAPSGQWADNRAEHLFRLHSPVPRGVKVTAAARRSRPRADHPDRFGRANLRTLQRRVQEGRGIMANKLIHATSEATLTGQAGPRELALAGTYPRY